MGHYLFSNAPVKSIKLKFVFGVLRLHGYSNKASTLADKRLYYGRQALLAARYFTSCPGSSVSYNQSVSKRATASSSKSGVNGNDGQAAAWFLISAYLSQSVNIRE
ncbi:hypothetical protein Zmor_028525 [Zophobas morio]|uniref:Uncharacterized protein n=1 Tax=Zophobas morio TaxID=2755281 RepID=A0AA38HK31_9CUCU|nr:hypothetical protein Zmor_028525 [Zophobas morio]